MSAHSSVQAGAPQARVVGPMTTIGQVSGTPQQDPPRPRRGRWSDRRRRSCRTARRGRAGYSADGLRALLPAPRGTRARVPPHLSWKLGPGGFRVRRSALIRYAHAAAVAPRRACSVRPSEADGGAPDDAHHAGAAQLCTRTRIYGAFGAGWEAIRAASAASATGPAAAADSACAAASGRAGGTPRAPSARGARRVGRRGRRIRLVVGARARNGKNADEHEAPTGSEVVTHDSCSRRRPREADLGRHIHTRGGHTPRPPSMGTNRSRRP